jgi:ElaB/YqjD/DUF883 family membrane-anchored ribosome-binding protein
MSAEIVGSREKLISDFKTVVADAEELLKATATVAGDQANMARARVKESLGDAKARLAAAEEVAVARAKEAAQATDEFVHDHPWKAIGLAAGIGLLVGLLIGRR